MTEELNHEGTGSSVARGGAGSQVVGRPALLSRSEDETHCCCCQEQKPNATTSAAVPSQGCTTSVGGTGTLGILQCCWRRERRTRWRVVAALHHTVLRAGLATGAYKEQQHPFDPSSCWGECEAPPPGGTARS